MGFIVKNVVRTAVIGTLAGGAVVAIAGPQRVCALFSQGKQAVNTVIDRQIDDPVALRTQLRDLEAQYPKRIGKVRSDLAEVKQQRADLEELMAESRLVVTFVDQDLDGLQTLLTRAEEARTEHGGGTVVRIRFDNQSLDLENAYAEANNLSKVRSAYAERAADLERDLGYLTEQESQLSTLLTQLESERAQFQAQLWQLDRQVDSIARNERLIEMMEKRQSTIDELSRYESASLDQITGKLGSIRAKQQAQLESLARGSQHRSYEDRAKFELQYQTGKEQFEKSLSEPGTVEIAPSVIEITPGDHKGDKSDGSVAYR